MQKKTIYAGGGLVLNDEGALLMIFRRGKWDLPKGKLDEGETIEACAVREVKEETGLRDVERGELIGITRHEYFDTYTNEDVVKESHWYAMRAPGLQDLKAQAEEDITDIRWVQGKQLQEYLENSFPSIVEIVSKAELL